MEEVVNKNSKWETVANDELSDLSARNDIIKSLISKRTENVDKINEYITSFVEKLRFQFCEDFNILKEIKNFFNKEVNWSYQECLYVVKFLDSINNYKKNPDGKLYLTNIQVETLDYFFKKTIGKGINIVDYKGNVIKTLPFDTYVEIVNSIANTMQQTEKYKKMVKLAQENVGELDNIINTLSQGVDVTENDIEKCNEKINISMNKLAEMKWEGDIDYSLIKEDEQIDGKE